MNIYSINLRNLLFAMIVFLFSIIAQYFVNNSINTFLEEEKCPFCYGNDYCQIFNNNEITFTNLSISERLSNLINVKNVYIAHHNSAKVILKKLGHNWELKNIDNIICEDQNSTDNCLLKTENYSKDFTSSIMENFKNGNEKNVANFKICNLSAINKFTKVLLTLNPHLNISFMTATLWTTILANVEPLLLQILNANDDWPVPQYYGACGRVVVEEYCGLSLNSMRDESWKRRASIALDLLKAADSFTNKHPLFRFYLTDVSSDNIAITEEYKIKFIDLENMIIAEKYSSFVDFRLHETTSFDCESCYAFSQDDICSHGISDHNYYSFCKLLLSKNAPWPMMTNGLLHSPPKHILEKYPDMFNLIEICAESSDNMNRLEASKRLLEILQIIIENE